MSRGRIAHIAAASLGRLRLLRWSCSQAPLCLPSRLGLFHNFLEGVTSRGRLTVATHILHVQVVRTGREEQIQTQTNTGTVTCGLTIRRSHTRVRVWIRRTPTLARGDLFSRLYRIQLRVQVQTA